ncbi:MAG: hypothetical protein ACK5M3_05565 [Dysgonomonas sp.]
MKYKRFDKHNSIYQAVDLPDINSPDFIEAFYPDYYSCNIIAYHDNLDCFLKKEITLKELSTRVGYEIKRPRPSIQREYNELTKDLQTKALHNFYRLVQRNEIEIIK